MTDSRTGLADRMTLLRPDTDLYSSTRVEPEQLDPLLSPGGVVILDDYRKFRGVRCTTDEFMAQQASAPLLRRVGYGARSGIKQAHRDSDRSY